MKAGEFKFQGKRGLLDGLLTMNLNRASK